MSMMRTRMHGLLAVSLVMLPAGGAFQLAASGVGLQFHGNLRTGTLRFRPTVSALRMAKEDSWQDVAEQLSNPFVPLTEKPDLLRKLVSQSQDVVKSLSDVASGNAKPEEELLGVNGKRQLKGARAVARQLREDILPEAATEGQRLVQNLNRQDGTSVPNPLQETFVAQLDDLTADGKLPDLPNPQDVVKTLTSELKNVFSPVPEGLESPDYSVLKTTEEYEIREYSSFVVCKTDMESTSEEMARSTSGGNAFNTLATFLFGKNSKNEAMDMTTPVISSVNRDGKSTTMSFVIPSKYDIDAMPQPLTDTVSLAIEERAKVAAREFPGFATEQEVVMQRDAMFSALKETGWTCLNEVEADVTVLQYNPPYTLPTVRKNEVIVKLDDLWIDPDQAEVQNLDDVPLVSQVAVVEPEVKELTVSEPEAEAVQVGDKTEVESDVVKQVDEVDEKITLSEKQEEQDKVENSGAGSKLNPEGKKADDVVSTKEKDTESPPKKKRGRPKKKKSE